MTNRARIVPELSPAEDQKQGREKKTRRENDLIVDGIFHHATVAPCFLLVPPAERVPGKSLRASTAVRPGASQLQIVLY